mgnify:CR=1 FL=1
MELLKVNAAMGQPFKASQDVAAEVRGTAFEETFQKVRPGERGDLTQVDQAGEIPMLVSDGERLHLETTSSDASGLMGKIVSTDGHVTDGEDGPTGKHLGELPTGAEAEVGAFDTVRKHVQTDGGFERRLPEHDQATSTLSAASRKNLITALSPVHPTVAGETAVVSPNLSANILPAGIAISHAAMPMATIPGAILSPPVSVIAELPLHVAQHVSSAAGTPERLVVQLDPPELGRVSIDFQYDARGMQQVLVTGETPEAVRQLRMMQAELAQSLDRFGIGGGNLLFEQSNSDNQNLGGGEPPPRNTTNGDESGLSIQQSGATPPKEEKPDLVNPTDGLDIRL